MAKRTLRSAGFSLVELAVVFLIVVLLLGSVTYTLSAMSKQRAEADTKRRLAQAKELILAFAIVNGRLPCPARSTNTVSPTVISAGTEVATAAGQCLYDGVEDHYGGSLAGGTVPAGTIGGLLPAKTLGFQEVDILGRAVDYWGNPIRYAVAKTVFSETAPKVICRPGGAAPATPGFTSAANFKNNGLGCLPNDLVVCRSATASAVACDANARAVDPFYTADDTTFTTPRGELVVAVIFSTGSNGTSNMGTNESRNHDGNGIFVATTSSSVLEGGVNFDDTLIWISYYELASTLIRGGYTP